MTAELIVEAESLVADALDLQESLTSRRVTANVQGVAVPDMGIDGLIRDALTLLGSLDPVSALAMNALAEEAGIIYSSQDVLQGDVENASYGEGRWVTLETGQHVWLGGDGAIQPSGPKTFKPLGGGVASKQGNEGKRSARGNEEHVAKSQSDQASHVRSQVSSNFQRQIEAHSNLTPEAKAAYSQAINRVLGKMPAAALERVQKNLKTIHFHESREATTAAWNKWMTDSGLPEQVIDVQKKRVNGYYSHPLKAANLDGATKRKEGFTGKEAQIHGTYAHEMTHAIDGNNTHSNSKEWRDAFASEIKGAGAGGQTLLTKYASTSRSEGFAEFGRVLYGSDKTEAEVKAAFPKCHAYFKRNGLI